MKGILLLILLLSSGFTGIAQKPEETKPYSGHLADEQGNGVEYATIVLLQDDYQKAGGTTDSNGNFILEAKAGTYTVIVQCLGYDPIRKNRQLPVSGQDTLVLKASAYALKEVVVQARNIERKADRFVVSVSPSAGKDGTELLSQAPGVWLAEDNISINGAQGTKVFVDDREIKLTGEDLLAYLRSLKSEDIKRIEIIPIAGAEYDASSRGGIIQISLRRRQNNGIQGNVTMGTALSSTFGRYLPAGTMNARIGKWTINAAASGTFTPKNDSEMTSERHYPDSNNRFSSLSELETRSGYGTGRIGTIYEIDTLNSIGAEIEYIGQKSKSGSLSQTLLTKGGFSINSFGDYKQREDYNTVAATANYLHKFDNKGSILKLIVDYANKKSTGKNDYHTRQKPNSGDKGGDKDSTYRSNADATYEIVTSDISMKKHIRKGMSFDAGLKYTHTLMDDNSQYKGLSEDQQWTVSPAYGYALKYKENILGVYAAFSAEINRWSLIAGLRGEYTRTSNESDHIKRDYFDLFPSLSATYAFNNLKTWMLVGQYARNIERPAFYTLNPNRLQTSDYSYNIGNPYLKPTYIHRFSTTLVYNYRYTLTVGASLHRNLIREFCKVDAVDPDVSYITYENHDIENHWFVAANIPMQLVSWLNLAANFVGVRQDIRMTEKAAFAHHYLAFTNATATFTLPKDITLEGQYNGASRLYSGNSEVAPRHIVSLFARKKLAGNRFLITISVANIFNRNNDFASHIEAYTSQSHFESGHLGRSFKATLTWNFNSGKKVKKSTIERGVNSERSRLNEK